MKKFTFSKVAGIQLATLLKNTPVSFKFFVNFSGIPILIKTCRWLLPKLITNELYRTISLTNLGIDIFRNARHG